MGVCVSVNVTKPKNGITYDNTTKLVRRNEKVNPIMLQTDINKGINNYDQEIIQEKREIKDLDQEIKNREPSLNELITMSFEGNHAITDVKKEEEKCSIKNKISNPSMNNNCEDELNVGSCSVYSTENEWSQAIKLCKKISDAQLANKILTLNERRWNKENIMLSDLIKSTRDNIDSYLLNKYLNNRIKLQEHYNWLIWAISIYYQRVLLYKSTEHFNSNSLGLPNADSTEWLSGFEWKGIYIKIMDENHSFKLKEEIKSMNYLFFEYIQILDCVPVSDKNIPKLLSNEIVFPLISYSKFNGIYLMGSVCIAKLQIDQNDSISHNVNNNNINGGTVVKTGHFKETIMNNNTNANDNFIKDKNSISHIENENGSIHLINDTNLYNTNMDLNQFSFEDFNFSHLFRNIKDSNLIKIIDNYDFQTYPSTNVLSKEKYMLINTIDLIPSLYYSNLNAQAMVMEESKPIIYEILKDPKSSHIEIIKAHMPSDTKDNSKYENNLYDVSYKIFANDYTYGRDVNSPVNSFFIQNCINQIGGLAEKISSASLNKVPWLKKVLLNPKNISIPNKAIVQYSCVKDIKVKYSLITQHESIMKCSEKLYDEQFHKKIKFTSYIGHFAKVINESKNIVEYTQLKQLFDRYGVNKIFQVFILARLSNSYIADLIKIDILTSIISKYVNFEEGINLTAKLAIVNYEFGNRDVIMEESGCDFIKEKHIANIRISKIFIMITTILNISSIPVDHSKKLIEQITFSLFIMSLKWRLLDKEFNFNIFTSKYFDDTISIYLNFSPEKLLNEMISIARIKPFQFITSLEKKLQFSINPNVKLTASITLDNFIKSFDKNTIRLNPPVIKSYINPIELTYYIFAKSIETTNKGLKYEAEKEQIQFNKMLISNNQPSINQSKLSHEQCDSSFQQDQPNVTTDKFSKNYVYKLKPNNITMINNKNNKYIESPSGTREIEQDSKLNSTDVRNNTKREEKANLNRMKYWDSISNVFQFNFPPLLYKLQYVYNENIKDGKTIYKYLDNSYKVKRIEAIKDWKNNAEIILNGIYSVNTGENTLLHVYLYLCLHYLYVDIDVKSAKEQYIKMKEKMQLMPSYSLNWLIIMNYLEGLLTETTSFIESEEFYSKTIIFTMYLFGDPRGRNNYGHYISLFPLWKIGRQTCILDNTLTNETLKELFYCQDFCFRSLISPLKSFQQNNCFIASLKYTSLLPQMPPKFKKMIPQEETLEPDENDDDKLCDCTDELLERPSLVPTISNIDQRFVLINQNFDSCMCSDISYFTFPSISDTKSSYINHFFSEFFFTFLLKGLTAIMFQGDSSPYNEEYLNKLNINCYSNTNQIMVGESPSRKMIVGNGNLVNSSSSKKLKGNNNILSPYLYEILLKRLDFKLCPPNGTVVAWGNNTHNETSHNNYNCLFFPRIVYKLKDQDISKIFAGWEHTIVISKEKKCFSWGNNQFGQCGVGQGQQVHNPTMIKKLFNIKEVACGNEHCLAINYEGSLYAWGNPEDGVLGLKSKCIEYTPVKISSIYGIQKITCGTIHNLALNKAGQVFSWGCSKGGQLGLSEDFLLSLQNFNGFLYEPTQIKSLQNEKIISISSGEAHSMALTSDGKVYTWGFGSNGQLGLGFCEDSFEPGLGLAKSRRLVPIPLSFEEKVSQIQCGKTFSMIITDKKELYAFGVNDLNQLGLDDEPPMNHLYNNIDVFNNKCSDYVTPTKLEIFINMQVLKIACGESHCLAVKTLWSWGSNRFGQLGQGNQNRKTAPKPVNYFLAYRNSEIVDIACGGFHSLCLLKSKEERSFDNDTAYIKSLIHNAMKNWNLI